MKRPVWKVQYGVGLCVKQLALNTSFTARSSSMGERLARRQKMLEDVHLIIWFRNRIWRRGRKTVQSSREVRYS